MFLQLKTVVWKTLIIKKRHYLRTIFEFLFPIFLFCVYVFYSYYKPTFEGDGSEKLIKNATYHDFKSISYNSLDVNTTQLYYSPNDKFYQDLIESIQVKLQVKKGSIKGFASSQALLQYHNTNNPHHNNTIPVIAIIFNKNDQKKLKYIIRDYALQTNGGCKKGSYWSSLDEDFGVMFASFLLYFAINILLDSYIVKKIYHWIWYHLIMRVSSSDTAVNPSNVNLINHHNILSVKNLCKSYSKMCQEVRIVKNVSFSSKDGECLGILGVNGAGKTTIFRMLTREEIKDQGSIQIEDNGRVIDINQNEYLEKLGYCPQEDALNFVLTGRQILSLFAHLHGINNPEIVNLFLKSFELETYADMPCGHYSGGNKRKLSLAVALMGFPKCILLDEPTCGVDPSGKRKIWSLMKKVQEKKKLSFILTSHSMVECEALCNNLIIMKDGIFEKEGTISDLKKEYGGFTIKLKLVDRSYDEVAFVPSTANKKNRKFDNIEELKEYFINNYGAEIKDEHSSLLHLCMKDKNKKWSTIFKEVEQIRMENSHLIEDYVISEASLEDIFLSVARS